jgi:DNA-binding PadR family transcriptional regulator
MPTKPHRTLTPLALVILGLLRERAMHPYEMQQTIRDQHTDQVIKLRAGSLYHTVERLQTLGLITAVETARAGRRPERTVYAITGEGCDEFAANLRQIISRPDREYPIFGAAIELLDSLEPAEAAELLERRMVALEAEVAADDQVALLLAKRGLERIHVVELEYAQALRRAELAWCAQLIDDIRSGTFHWQVPGTEDARKAEDTP